MIPDRRPADGVIIQGIRHLPRRPVWSSVIDEKSHLERAPVGKQIHGAVGRDTTVVGTIGFELRSDPGQDGDHGLGMNAPDDLEVGVDDIVKIEIVCQAQEGEADLAVLGAIFAGRDANLFRSRPNRDSRDLEFTKGLNGTRRVAPRSQTCWRQERDHDRTD